MKRNAIFAVPGLFLVLVLAVTSLSLHSCASSKLPSDVTATISRLGTDLPRLMGQASNPYTPQYGEQAQAMLRDIKDAATAAGRIKKHKKLADMLNGLAKNNVQPFVDSWKMKGQLDASAITSGIGGVNNALAAIKKQAKM
jgi:translation initiation factor 2 alpha subunit (eIF-2alpha)